MCHTRMCFFTAPIVDTQCRMMSRCTLVLHNYMWRAMMWLSTQPASCSTYVGVKGECAGIACCVPSVPRFPGSLTLVSSLQRKVALAGHSLLSPSPMEIAGHWCMGLLHRDTHHAYLSILSLQHPALTNSQKHILPHSCLPLVMYIRSCAQWAIRDSTWRKEGMDLDALCGHGVTGIVICHM